MNSRANTAASTALCLIFGTFLTFAAPPLLQDKDPQEEQEQEQNPNQPQNQQQGATLTECGPIHTTTQEQFGNADEVIHGVVKNTAVRYVDKPLPNGKTTRVIATYYQIEILKDHAKTTGGRSTYELEMPGGNIGQDTMWMSGMPTLPVGEEVILPIHGNRRKLFPLPAAANSIYRVDRSSGRPMVHFSQPYPHKKEYQLNKESKLDTKIKDLPPAIQKVIEFAQSPDSNPEAKSQGIPLEDFEEFIRACLSKKASGITPPQSPAKNPIPTPAPTPKPNQPRGGD